MNPAEIHLAYFPFGGTVGRKLRPVLLLTGPVGSVPEVLVAYMTSIMVPSLIPTDLVLDPAKPDHASSNLKAVSLLRLHKLATIHECDVVRKIGELSGVVKAEVLRRLRLLLNLP